MNWNDYRKAVDALPLSADFQERTEELVRRTAKIAELEKECISVKKKGFIKAVSIAAAVALLTVSAYAASRWLSRCRRKTSVSPWRDWSRGRTCPN